MSLRSSTIQLIKKYTIVSQFKFHKSSEDMTKIILVGSFIVDTFLAFLLSISLVSLGHTYVLGRIEAALIVFGYLVIVSLFVYKRRVHMAAWMLVILYGVVGIAILHFWGVNAPIGILILGFVIVLTGTMLGAKRILIVTIGIITSLVVLQFFNIIGISQPDRSMLDDASSFGDVAGYSVIFLIFATISWLSGSKMEDTLERALHAEAELQRERNALASRVEEQRNSLKRAQQKELKQLYKFAELGQLTTIILHELANYLSVLTLDIDDLNDRHENSIAIEHAKESIFYIDTIIDQVRNQIRDSDDVQKFDALSVTKDTLEQLRKKLNESNIKLFIEDASMKHYFIFGDPLRFSQAITILVTNAAQASSNKRSEISVEVSTAKSNVLISVKDFGSGISKEARRTLFQPQKSKKGTGLGIGLYVTKQIIDTHFKGKIWISPATEYTQFNIEIPKIKR